jgi:hypothetical protein
LFIVKGAEKKVWLKEEREFGKWSARCREGGSWSNERLPIATKLTILSRLSTRGQKPCCDTPFSVSRVEQIRSHSEKRGNQDGLKSKSHEFKSECVSDIRSIVTTHYSHKPKQPYSVSSHSIVLYNSLCSTAMPSFSVMLTVPRPPISAANTLLFSVATAPPKTASSPSKYLQISSRGVLRVSM